MPTTTRRTYWLDDAVNTVATSPEDPSSKAPRESANRSIENHSNSESGWSLLDEDSMIEERYPSYVESLQSGQSKDNRNPALLNVAPLKERDGDGGSTDSGDTGSIIDLIEDISITENSSAGCNLIFSDFFCDFSSTPCVGANAFCSNHQNSPTSSNSEWQKEYKTKLVARYDRIVEEKGDALRQAHRLHETLTVTNDSTVKTLTQRCHSLEALNRHLQAEIQQLQDRGKLLELKYKVLQHRYRQQQATANQGQ